MTDEQIRHAIADLLRAREPDATICPSEAARALAPDAWRALMPRVREVAIALAKQGEFAILQRGRVIAVDEPPRGPIRIGRGSREATAIKGSARRRRPAARP